MNYSDIQTNISNILRRSQSDLIKGYIMLAELRIRDGSADSQYPTEPFKCLQTNYETTLSAIKEQDYVDLPVGFRGFTSGLYIITGGKKHTLTQNSLQQMQNDYYSSNSNIPDKYAISGKKIYLAPTPSDDYTIYTEIRQFPILSDTDDTNDVLTEYPNIYIFGAALEGCIALKKFEEATMYYRTFAAAINAINTDYMNTQWSGSPMQASRTDMDIV